jgi:ribosomal protein S18 acetylase RimI-like enzyme
MRYREATVLDIPVLVETRRESSPESPADPRMAAYLKGQHDPQHALVPRIIYVAIKGSAFVGYIGGHLTTRFGCDGELQYLYVVPSLRRSGVASELLRRLAMWFDAAGTSRICVDVEPTNQAARGFYFDRGAEVLNSHWLVWQNLPEAMRSRGGPQRPTPGGAS